MTAEDTRQVWGSKLQFLLTCIGYAVGLGNLWKFPSEAYKNGGGAFLLPYIICSVFIGLPCLYLELFLGQFTRSGASRAFRHYAPIFQGLGWMSTAMSAMVGIYYNVVVAVCLIYLKDVVFGRRDRWTSCEWEWNTEKCVRPNNTSAGNDSVLAPDEYYTRNVFEYERTLINWQLLAVLFIVWLLTAICLVKGVKWIGRIAYVTATVPYILIGALFINCIRMDGALKGIKYFLTPEFSVILKSDTWIAAAKQMCLSISVGYGGILSLASYNERSHNCFKDAVIIVFADSFMSIFGGCVVFSTLGYLNHETKKEIDTLAKSKNGLAFSVYPEALENMFLGNVWGFLLFFMFFLLGISSQFGSTQTLVTSIVDQFPKLKTGPVAVVICSISFLLGIAMCTGSGFDFQNLMSDRVGGSVVLLSCLLEILILIHYYGVFNFMHDLRCCLGVGRTKFSQIFGYTGHFFAFLWTIVTPILLAILVGFSIESSINPKNDKGEPEEKGAKYVAGLIIEYIPLVLLPFFFIYNIYIFSQKKEGWKEAFKVQKEHPSYERIRLGGKIFPTA